MNHQSPCPECGKPLPEGSAHDICPACLMEQVMASRTLDTNAGNKTVVPPPSPEEIAGKFPQFEVVECLGRGGMGVVYKAKQKSLDRWVAIKVLAPERVHEERFAEHFEREAKTLAKMSHPNIVTVFDHGETDGLFYIVMEFVDGVNLRDLLREGKMEPEQALAIVPPICDALEYAHDKGVVHRDIKPENILLDREGRVKIADFGIASLVGATGEKSGTPPYMAPEQEHGHVDRRSDIYSLGAVLYEMLTGERPTDKIEVPSKRVQVDVRIDEIVLRALETKPELRYQTIAEMRTLVETVSTHDKKSDIQNPKSETPAPDSPKRMSFGRLIVGCLVFGFIMAIREEFHDVWLRAGIAAFAAVGGFLVAISHRWAAADSTTPATPQNEPRFSRAAIVGVCWLAFVPLHFLLPLVIPPEWQHNPLIELLAIVIALLFWTAPIGVTTLGWIAVSQIRRSAGKLHGMWLAVFDGLLFPLLALDASILAIPFLITKLLHFKVLFLVPPALIVVMSLDILIVRYVWRALKSNSTAPTQNAPNHKPNRVSRKGILIAAWVLMAVSFAALFINQWNERRREGVWTPARISDTITQQYGDAQVRVVDVSQTGQVVLVTFTCEMFRLDHELLVQYNGPVLSYPNDLASSVKSKAEDLDCLIAPKAKLVGDNIGELISGTNVLSDREMFRIGFVLPDAETAAKVVKAVQETHLGKPRGLSENGNVLLLFSLRRDSGKDASGKPVVEGLDTTLWSRPKSVATVSDKPKTVSEPSFGPVVERVIVDRMCKEVLVVAKDAPKQLLNLTSGEGLLLTEFSPSWVETALSSKSEIEALRGRHVDLGCDLSQSRSGLMAWDCSVQEIDRAGWSATGNPDEKLPTLSNKSLNDLIRELPAPGMNTMQLLTGNLPGVWLLKNRDGNCFIIEAYETTEHPPGVKIRYMMVQGAPEPSASASNLSFGPLMERVVTDAIDLDSGKTETAPLDGMLKTGKDALLANIKGIEGGGWDIIMDNAETIFGVGMKAVPLDAAQWDTMSPAKSVEQIVVSPIQALVHFSSKASFPATCAFQTREGSMGILQITGFTEDKRGVKIRYRMVQSENKNSAQATPLSVEISGLVARPGRHSLRSYATLLDALAAAGGWTGDANLKATIAETDENHFIETTSHDLKAILDGRVVNPSVPNGARITFSTSQP